MENKKGFYLGLLIFFLIVNATFLYFVNYLAHFNDIPCSFEKLEVISADVISQNVIVVVKNTGCVDTTVTNIYVDSKTLPAVNGGTSNPKTPIPIKVEESKNITLTFNPPLPSATYALKIEYNGSSTGSHFTVP